ncbi:MAG: hypothetical protein Q8N39_03985 [Pelolinea sp.]|nr:hypothetical protein [Pelolinea sp.]
MSVGLIGLAVWGVAAKSSSQKVQIQVVGSPKIWVDQESFDYGNVRLGTPIFPVIRVANIGDQPLIFIEAPYIEVLAGC